MPFSSVVTRPTDWALGHGPCALILIICARMHENYGLADQNVDCHQDEQERQIGDREGEQLHRPAIRWAAS